jgi:hypothetical protein
MRPKRSAIQVNQGRDRTLIKVPIALLFATGRGALTLAMSGPFLESSLNVPKPRNRTSSLLRSMIASGTRRHGADHPGASHIECSGEAQFAQGVPDKLARRRNQTSHIFSLCCTFRSAILAVRQLPESFNQFNAYGRADVKAGSARISRNDCSCANAKVPVASSTHSSRPSTISRSRSSAIASSTNENR